METKVKQVELKNEFRICPVCDYKDGFHTMFQKDGSETKWLFICPNCHNIFDIGLTLPG